MLRRLRHSGYSKQPLAAFVRTIRQAVRNFSKPIVDSYFSQFRLTDLNRFGFAENSRKNRVQSGRDNRPDLFCRRTYIFRRPSVRYDAVRGDSDGRAFNGRRRGLRRSNYKSRSRSVAARQQVGRDVLLALILLLGAYNNRTRRHSIFQLFRYRLFFRPVLLSYNAPKNLF